MVSICIPSLESLPFNKIEDGTFIAIDDLVKFLKSNHSIHDRKKTVKKENILQELQRHDTGIIQREENKLVSLSSFFRYMFHHYDDFQVCKLVCYELLEQQTQSISSKKWNKSTWNLYQELASVEILSLGLYKETINKLQLEGLKIPSLIIDYKTQFTESEWNKIKLFEWHYSSFCKKEVSDYEDEQESKWEFFGLCKELAEKGQELNHFCLKVCQRNVARKFAADAINGITIHLESVHRPEKIETDTENALRDIPALQFQNIICFQCTNVCTHKTGVHIVIELQHLQHNVELYDDISLIVRASLKKSHNLYVPVILFFPNGCLLPGERFLARSHLKSGKLQPHYASLSSCLDDQNLPEEFGILDSFCFQCFKEEKHWLADPLDINHFQIMREWRLHVPLPFQCLLEQTLLNKDSLRRRSSDDFYTSKLSSLYCLFDSSLNILNRNYSGLIQDIVTDELFINYHNITSVFSITSATNTSQSLRNGDRRLKKAADPELCHFKTYLKPYPLCYIKASEFSASEHLVCLRDCYLIFFMDNLVQLTMKTDPQPGERRISQLCTLPITIKGIPKDSNDVLTWHLPLCEEKEDCACKEVPQLKKEDLEWVLLKMTTDEECAFESFQRQATWGLKHIWTRLTSLQPFTKILDKAASMENSGFQEENVDLDESFSSLAIHDVEKMETVSNDERHENFPLNISNEDIESINGATTSTTAVDNNGVTVEDMKSIQDEPNVSCDMLPYIDVSDIDEEDVQPINEDKMNENRQEEEDEDDDYSNIRSKVDANQDILQDVQALLEEIQIPFMTNKDETEVCDTDSSIREYQDLKNTPSPPLLCCHPPPFSGRDDDIVTLKVVLDDFLEKAELSETNEKVIFAPDYKIARNLFKLIDGNKKYATFLPEFPVLHLRKSKIINLIAAYETSGLIHILKYMRDDDIEKDCSKLVTIENIEKATRNVWRLSAALHISVLVTFIKSLPQSHAEELKKDLCDQELSVSHTELRWGQMLKEFIKKTSTENKTFSLHVDIMRHCDEIVAIAVAERLGGKDGYSLLLASVKSSLPFSFLNGASSYAGFCTRLLIEHYKSSHFHRQMKHALFSTSHNDSIVRFGLDTAREIDHRDAKKCIRPGATLGNVMIKMSTVDEQRQVHTIIQSVISGEDVSKIKQDETKDEEIASKISERYMGKKASDNDLGHIVRTVCLIHRRNGMSSSFDPILRNVYHKENPEVQQEILDSTTEEIGKFMIHRYAARECLLGMTLSDCPNIELINGPRHLINRIKRSKGSTIKRTKGLPNNTSCKSMKEKSEEKRKRTVKKMTTIVDCLSSSMNTCQSIFKPDGTKSSSNKSAGVKRALLELIKKISDTRPTSDQKKDLPDLDEFILTDFKALPQTIKEQTKASVVEFAGVKFKTSASTGDQYIEYVSKAILHKLIGHLPNLRHIVICEEKYSFTPDTLKAHTRKKRDCKGEISIIHLKEEKEVISADKFHKPSVVGTSTGKKLVSSYLGSHIEQLLLQQNMTLDIDSEALLTACHCQEVPCICCPFTTPLRVRFTSESGIVGTEKLTNIRQRKGEAEMAQLDWMKELDAELSDGDIVVNFVSSADIDTVLIHLIGISLHWKRNQTGTFTRPVYVWLQKQKPELYNISKIIESIERYFNKKYSAALIAIILCMGGNDFLPRHYGISHERILMKAIDNQGLELFKLFHMDIQEIDESVSSIALNIDAYINFIKDLYCPKIYNAAALSFDEVRQMTIKMPGKEFRHPQTWMPPESALRNLGSLIQAQIDYLLTTWCHEAALPDLLRYCCISMCPEGEVYYSFGDDVHVSDKEQLLSIPEELLQEKINCAKQTRVRTSKKRALPDTPHKQNPRKRQPLMSTPRKMKFS